MTQSKLPSFLLATWLLGTIATKSRMSDFLQSLQEYEIVYPRVIPNENVRNRRSTQEDRENLHQEPVFLKIGKWTLRTVANDRLILSSNFTVNWVRRSKVTFERRNANGNCDLRQGNLEGEAARSFVAVTICEEEVYALMLIGQRSFCVQPLTNGSHVMFQPRHQRWWSIKDNSGFVSVNSENPAGRSIKFEIKENKRKSKRSKRDSLSHYVQRGFYNLSGDVYDVEYPEAEKLILYDEKDDVPREYNGTTVQELSIDVNSEEIGYFSDPKWQRNRLPRKRPAAKDSSPRWLELGIAADYSVVDFHGIRVQQYILALLNIVSAIYMDSSLQSNMILVVVEIILYAEKQDGMVRRGDARRSLENVNKWNRKMLSSKDVNHDVAVWLTRLDIGGPSGYAPVSGVCDPARSCALNRDEGLTSAFIVAHEVAHM